MTRGFFNSLEFAPIIGWELYQVTLDKFHAMFWFENGHALLNVADSFSFRSASGKLGYTFRLPKSDNDTDALTFLDVGSILRRPVRKIEIESRNDLGLIFDNGDRLIVHDNPRARSWWFYHYSSSEQIPNNLPLKWAASDIDPADA